MQIFCEISLMREKKEISCVPLVARFCANFQTLDMRNRTF